MSSDSFPKKVEPKLVRNAAKCLDCGDVVESKSRHDFRSCRCGNIFVDGGLSYIRRGFRDESKIEDLSEYEVDPSV